MHFDISGKLDAHELKVLARFRFWHSGWKTAAATFAWGASLVTGVVLFLVYGSPPDPASGTLVAFSTATAIFLFNEAAMVVKRGLIVGPDPSKAVEDRLWVDDAGAELSGVFVTVAGIPLFLPRRTFESADQESEFVRFLRSKTQDGADNSPR